jgi:hypothetical protein
MLKEKKGRPCTKRVKEMKNENQNGCMEFPIKV